MKRHLKTASLALLLGLTAGTREQSATPALAPIGPLGYWRCDDAATPGKVMDASGNGFHGTCTAGATPSPTVPTLKSPNPGSLNLDGTAGMVTIADAPILRLSGDMTLSFWKRKTAASKDWTRIIGKGNGAQRNFGLWEFPENGQLKFQCFGQGGQSVLELDTPAPTAINTWVHVICMISVNSAFIYIDGKLVAQGARSAEPGIAADPLTFGHAGYHSFWAGQLDDIRLYNRGLSMGEIVYLASGQGVPAAPAALTATGNVLKWTASPTPPPAGTVTYYTIKRTLTPGKDYTTIGWGVTGTTFTDYLGEAGKAYSYVATALNTAGESVPSNEVTAAAK